MADARGQVRPKARVRKADVSAALAQGWGRVSAGRKEAFEHALEVDRKTLGRWLAEVNLPEAHTMLASLGFDPTALDEVLALYGARLIPLAAAEGEDMALATALAASVAEYLERLSDGVRCHRDTLALEALFRPLIPRMQAIVEQADRLRGAGG